MPANELCGGVDHDVCAILKGSGKEWSGEGVVDDERNAKLLSDPGDLFKGEDVDARIAEGLAKQDLRIGPNSAAEVLGVFRSPPA